MRKKDRSKVPSVQGVEGARKRKNDNNNGDGEGITRGVPFPSQLRGLVEHPSLPSRKPTTF